MQIFERGGTRFFAIFYHFLIFENFIFGENIKKVSTKSVRDRRSFARAVQKHGCWGWSRYFLGGRFEFYKKSQDLVVMVLLKKGHKIVPLQFGHKIINFRKFCDRIGGGTNDHDRHYVCMYL